MKNSKYLLMAAIAAHLAGPGTAAADDDWVNLYGKIFLTLDKVDEDNGDDQWELNSNASRIGVKGKGAAGNLEAFYQMEWEVDLTDNSKSSSDHIKARNQFVGLRGDFGEILAGRNDSPLKKSQQKVDLFNDTQFDIKTALNGENRISGVVQYATPKVNGFKGTVAFIPGEDTGSNDGVADGVSISGAFKAGDVSIVAAYDDGVDGDDVETMRVSALYKTGALQLGLIYQDTDAGVASGDGIVASLSYKIDSSTLKLQVVDSDIWSAGISSKVKYESQTIVGWDYKIASKTTFVSYFGMAEEGASGDEDTIFGVGVVQKF